jgi:hypothetical protein
MTGLEWILWSILAAFYVCCLFTVCLITFQKGHTLLGIVGIFIPLLWLFGALLPAKPGSSYEARERSRFA